MHIDLVMGQKFLPCMFANNVTGILSFFFSYSIESFLDNGECFGFTILDGLDASLSLSE